MARTLGCSLDVRRRPQWTRAIGVTLLLALAACGAADPARAHGVSAVQFQDVVVPSGLRLVDDAHRSHSRQEVDWRMGHFEYVGQVDIVPAANYVRERMPQHSWSKVRDEVTDTETKLRFERGNYAADYSFTRSEGATVMVVDYRTDYTRR
jgi:hypothetical protein